MAYLSKDNLQNDTVSGSVIGIIFQSEDSGYTVCEIDTNDKEPAILVGTMPYLAEGDIITAAGKWINHPTYGRQFKVSMYEKTLPTTEDEIYRYLSSGAVSGIGPKTAEKIVDRFGEDTFDVIENHPDWLTEISGITKKRATEISSRFSDISGSRNVMMFCSSYFGTTTSLKIFKKWGGSAIDRIKKNPYSLCENFSGIGFTKADSIASDCGIIYDSDERISAGILFVLSTASRTMGHTCLPLQKLICDASDILGVEESKVLKNIEKLCAMAKLVTVEQKNQNGEKVKMVYSAKYRKAEIFCAKKLISLNQNCPTVSKDDIAAFIAKSEAETGISYAKLQKEAVFSALSSGVTVLTGGPGTGKTTIIKCLISIFCSIGYDVALAAPTGRAAKRMSEATGEEAKTVHRLLEMEKSDGGDEPQFLRNDKNYLEEKVIIIDETSMLDILLLEALLKAVRPGCRLIFLGDRNQLPSVGAGNVLADLLDCNIFNTVCLTEYFRQSQDSRIIVNAHLINNGEMPDTDNKSSDFFYLSRQSDRDIALTVADLAVNRLPKAYGKDMHDSIQIITPSRKGEAGTIALNALLQEKLNPPAKDKVQKESHGVLFRVGDKIMQNKNDYSVVWEKDGIEGVGVFNGDIGNIQDIDTPTGIMELSFDGRITEYDFSQLDELEHAFAITVHKSQGSEYPVVIIPLYGCAPMLLSRNLLYTAVTRAEKMVILVGRKDILKRMVDNNSAVVRYSCFKETLLSM